MLRYMHEASGDTVVDRSTLIMIWKGPMKTRLVGGRVTEPLYDGARRSLGLPEDCRDSDLIRHAFAALAGLDVRDHTPKHGGTRPGAGRRKP